MQKRKPCLNCDGPNNGTGDLCSSCYIVLGRLTWAAILAGQRPAGYPTAQPRRVPVLCDCSACSGGRYSDCVYSS